MSARCRTMLLCLLTACPAAAEDAAWWSPKLRYRVTVRRPTPWRDETPRPVEVALDFPTLLRRAGFGEAGGVADLHVVEREPGRTGRELPCALRTERCAETGGTRRYLAWWAAPRRGQVGTFQVYFNVRSGEAAPPLPVPDQLPPENLLRNGRFAEHADGRPAHWETSPAALVRVGEPSPALAARPLKIVVDGSTPPDAPREVSVSQKLDVRRYAGCEMLFECDLLAERAAYGAPVSIEIQQFRADGSRIGSFAVDPRWLTIELAAGQVVRLRQRGRFAHDAATAAVCIRARCSVRDADTNEAVAGAESFFTVWVDRVVVRPGERWPWPPASGAGFVEGAIPSAPVNRAFEFTGLRRVAFNGASEGTLTTGRYGKASSVHWGLAAGTLELWCRPKWSADDGREHVFFRGVAYGHRLQSRLRKRGADGDNRLELAIADAGGTLRTVRGRAALKAGQWHHLAATWDLPKAHLQLFVDGKRVAQAGPGEKPWPWSTIAVGGKKKAPGIGISQADTRSLPMQAFIGGDHGCRPSVAADAALDELRISDVPRYADDFAPRREELAADAHTRALFHFENDPHGVHDGDDRFVRGHLACELEPQQDGVLLEELEDGRVEARRIVLHPRADGKLFEANRAHSRLPVRRPLREPPDARFVACCPRQRGFDARPGAEAKLTVGGDYEPWMGSITYQPRDIGRVEEPTVIPRLRANDNVVPFSAADLAATLAPDAPDDAARALAAFRYALQTTSYYDAHYCETLPARHRPRVSYTLVKSLNIYPFDQCGPLNYMLRKLFLAVGVSSNDASGTHHQFEQAFYGGDWRLFDLSPRLYWLRRDNQTVAGRRGFEEDLYLKLRQGSGVTSALRGRPSRARFGQAQRPHRMDLTLRPGERAAFCWHNEGRWLELMGDRQPIALAKIPPSFGNGAILWRPQSPGDVAAADNVGLAVHGEGPATLAAKDPKRPAHVVYDVHCPYIVTGLEVRGECSAPKAGDVALLLSFDQGRTWRKAWENAPTASKAFAADLGKDVMARYAFRLKVLFPRGGPASISALTVRTTFVVSPLSLPGRLSLGKNRIRFVGPQPTHPVQAECRWIERHRTNLGLSLEAISYYLDGDKAHRSVVIAPPGKRTPITATVEGDAYAGEVTIEGLPEGWLSGAAGRHVEIAGGAEPARVTWHVTPKAAAGEVLGFSVGLSWRGREAGRRVWGQVLVADAPLAREAERAERIAGAAKRLELPAASGRSIVAMSGSGQLGFDLTAPKAGTYALWLRARWRQGSSTAMELALDGGKPRSLRATAMIGFTDWTDPTRAHTKMFAHYGEQYAHWSWYRIPDVKLASGKHRLTLAAEKGAAFDALVLLPAAPEMDRAAMNLLQNWNYAPWHHPL